MDSRVSTTIVTSASLPKGTTPINSCRETTGNQLQLSLGQGYIFPGTQRYQLLLAHSQLLLFPGEVAAEDLHLDPGRNQLLVHLLAVLGPVEGCHILELQQVWGPGPLILQM